MPADHPFDASRYAAGPRQRLLLCVIHFEGRIEKGGRANFKETMPPLDIAYLAAAARAAGHEVSVLILRDLEEQKALLKDRLLSFAPEAVGFSCNLANYDTCFAAAALVKAARPATRVVFGGPQASAGPDLCLADRNVDAVVTGEGEITLLELLTAWGTGAPLEGMPGLVVRGADGRPRRGPARPLIDPLDSLPPPALELYDREFWNSSYEGRPAGAVLGSRGCPFECTFCATKVVWGRTNRFHSPERVVAEMTALDERYGIKHFGFYDNTFTLDRARAARLCRLIAERGAGEWTWSCGTRTELVDADILSEMKRAGCRSILYGFESGSQRILDRIKKKTTLASYRKAVKLTRSAGIEVGASFIIGFPTETPEETAATVRLAVELMPDGCGVNIAIPFMGTELNADALAHGRLRDGYGPEDMARCNDIWIPEGRTRKELDRWRQLALRRIRPKAP